MAGADQCFKCVAVEKRLREARVDQAFAVRIRARGDAGFTLGGGSAVRTCSEVSVGVRRQERRTAPWFG